MKDLKERIDEIFKQDIEIYDRATEAADEIKSDRDLTTDIIEETVLPYLDLSASESHNQYGVLVSEAVKLSAALPLLNSLVLNKPDVANWAIYASCRVDNSDTNYSFMLRQMDNPDTERSAVIALGVMNLERARDIVEDGVAQDPSILRALVTYHLGKSNQSELHILREIAPSEASYLRAEDEALDTI